jgi:hypothetical protein
MMTLEVKPRISISSIAALANRGVRDATINFVLS